MKELKKKYIKPYACVHECAYGEMLQTPTATAGATDTERGENAGENEQWSRPNGNPTFFELDDENEDF